MDCEQVKEYLSEYVDGFATPEQKKQIEAHLAQCAACQKEADALWKLRGEIRALKMENTDDFVFDSARARAAAPLPLYRQKWLRSASAAAACFVLLIGVYTAVQNGYRAPVNQQIANELQADETQKTAPCKDAVQEREVVVKSRTAEVPVSDSYLYKTLPEGATIYSKGAGVVEEDSVQAQTEQPIFYDATINGSMDAEAEEALPQLSAADEAVDGNLKDSFAADFKGAPVEKAESVQTDNSAVAAGGGGGGASSGGSASYGGSAAAHYTKRTVTFAVSAEAKDEFAAALTEVQATVLEGETLIDAAALQRLLAVEGVHITADAVTQVMQAHYSGKIVILY